MSNQSKTLQQSTAIGTNSATSSRGLEHGPTLSDKRDGQTIEKSGPHPSHASLSPRQAKEKGLLTHEISGLPSSGLSSSANLSSSLVSRLATRTESLGSTLYRLTWSERVTPWGRSYFRLVASAHRTSDNDCTGWPTPIKRDWKDVDTDGKVPPKGILGRLVWEAKTTKARSTSTGQLVIGFSAETENGDRLNAAHTRWLMGLPIEWDELAPMATASSLRKQQNS